MKRVQQGFTLIELMIVVAIIGILAAVAIPVYQDFTQRAKVAEAYSSTDGAKLNIAEFYQSNGTWPAAQTVTGVYSSGASSATTGVVTVTMAAGTGTDIAGKTLTFTPVGTASGATAWYWTCASTAKQKFVPKDCVGA